MRPRVATPALLQRTSTRPLRFHTSCASASIASGSRTSVTMTVRLGARRAQLAHRAIERAALDVGENDREAFAREAAAPCANPIPDAPPVTTATCPFSSFTRPPGPRPRAAAPAAARRRLRRNRVDRLGQERQVHRLLLAGLLLEHAVVHGADELTLVVDLGLDHGREPVGVGGRERGVDLDARRPSSGCRRA